MLVTIGGVKGLSSGWRGISKGRHTEGQSTNQTPDLQLLTNSITKRPHGNKLRLRVVS